MSLASRQNVLSKNTLIPLGLVVSIAGTIVAISFFASNVSADIRTIKDKDVIYDAKISDNSQKISALEKEQSVVETKLDYISNTVTEISKKLNIIP